MSDYELEPCPFCGSELIHAEIYSPLEEFRIYCAGGEGCLAEMRLAFSDAGVVGKRLDFDKAKQVMDEMVELWNTRAQLSPPERYVPLDAATTAAGTVRR